MEQWTEKYRPQVFGDIVGNGEQIFLVKNMIESEDRPPHLLFVGLYGVGKTALAHIIKNHVYGKAASLDFREINAGDERGIDNIREEVDRFMRSSSLDNNPYVTLFIDEIDRMTPDAQMALNRKLEVMGSNCWVIAAANLVNKKRMNPALLSRFKIIKLEPVDADSILEYLKYIASEEDLKIDNSLLVEIANTAETQVGNVRWAINALYGVKYGEHIKKTAIIDNILGADPFNVYELVRGLGSGEIFTILFDEVIKKHCNDRELAFDLLKIWRKAETASQYSYLPVGHIACMLMEMQKRLKEE